MSKADDLEKRRQQLLAEDKHLRESSALRGPPREQAFAELKAKWAFHQDETRKWLSKQKQ